MGYLIIMGQKMSGGPGSDGKPWNPFYAFR